MPRMTAASVHNGSYVCTAHLHGDSDHNKKLNKQNTYLTFSRFFIDEIANSKYSFMDSSPMADISSNVNLRLSS